MVNLTLQFGHSYEKALTFKSQVRLEHLQSNRHRLIYWQRRNCIPRFLSLFHTK